MQNNYYALISSLPYIDSLFNSKIAPISRLQLNHRLTMLEDHHRNLLFKLEKVLESQNAYNDEDQNLINLADSLYNDLSSEALKKFLAWNLDLITLMVAIRRKTKGFQIPSKPKWSFGSLYCYIRNNWEHPFFALQHAFPWIGEAKNCILKNDRVKLEKILLNEIWKKLNRLSFTHNFDFEAVVIYVMKWSLVNRWVRYNSSKSLDIFKDILHHALNNVIPEN